LINYILSLLLGYSIGSLPTAYLLVKWKSRVDIRESGSGNVGALNAFEVSSSKLLGLGVLLIDLIKGSAAVWLSSRLIGQDVWIMGTAGFGTILGHNYSVWLGFKGGRGLATAAGVMLVLSWICVVIWCTIWLVIYLYVRNVHASNISASVLSPAAAWLTPPSLQTAPAGSGNTYAVAVLVLAVLCVMILQRHIQYLPELRRFIHKSKRSE